MNPLTNSRDADRYPTIGDLQQRAHRKLPRFIGAYLETGTGDETGLTRNREGLDAITLLPRYLKGKLKPDIGVSVFGESFDAPFGVAPIGIPGAIWPGTEEMLAQAAARHNIGFCLSCVAAETPEYVGPHAGDKAWFQLYPTTDASIRDDLLARARDNGFKTLLVTADVPWPSRRERLRRAGLRMPPAIDARMIAQSIVKPHWAMTTMRKGLPKMQCIEKYATQHEHQSLALFYRDVFSGELTWSELAAIRQKWEGPLVLKGILHPDDVDQAINVGVDGIVVSNHGARQFDAGPAPIAMLPLIARRVNNRVTVVYDSGVRSGLDIIRAIACGADFVMLGRPFLYAVAALQQRGGDHLIELLKDDMKTNMAQLGVNTLEQLADVSRGPQHWT